MSHGNEITQSFEDIISLPVRWMCVIAILHNRFGSSNDIIYRYMYIYKVREIKQLRN